MPLQKPDIVIFDMDGTAVRHINPRLLHILEFLDDMSFKLTRIFTWLFERRAQGPVFIEGECFEAKKQPRLLVHRAIHKVRRKPVEQIVEPCPGIYAVLALLDKHNIPMALVSNGLGKGYGYDILEKFGLSKYFKATIFREDIEKSKPHPQSLLLSLQRMDITPKDSDVIWYIGDRHKDVKAALAASDHISGTIVPIACALNAAMAALNNGLTPEHIIMSYFDMHNRLEQMLSANQQEEAA